MAKTLQDQILDDVLSRYPKRSAAVEALSELLGVRKDAIYRRLRGDTILSPKEINLLAQTYKISVDSYIFNQSDALFFTYSVFTREINNMGDYLDGVAENLQRVKQLPDVNIYYAASEVNFFYYNFFPELISFKLYIWGRAFWEFEYLKNRPFDFDVISHPEMEKTQEVLKSFLEIDTKELWSPNILFNTLSQIEYFLSMGVFRNPSDALVICDRMTQSVDHWQLMAESGSKFMLGTGPDAALSSLELFHHEVLVTSDAILVSSPAGKALFNIFNNPNYLLTSDEMMCNHQEDWFKKAIGKSTPISLNNAKSRALYFNHLRSRIAETRLRIEQGI